MNKLNHIIFTPDGCRRWAEKNNRPVSEAYLLFGKIMTEIADKLIVNEKIPEITFFTSEEYNFDREEQEAKAIAQGILNFIMLLKSHIKTKKLDAEIRLVGELDKFFSFAPGQKDLIKAFTSKTTSSAPAHKINIMCAYNGEKELLRAIENCKNAGQAVKSENYLKYWPISKADLFIRTGQDEFIRTSSYFPGIEQAQLFGIAATGPDFTSDEVISIISKYKILKYRFEKTANTQKLK